MSAQVQARLRAMVMFVAPVVILAGFIVLPYVDNEMDNATVAAAVTGDPDRWAWASLILIVALGLTFLMAFSVRRLLRDGGEDRWSFIALPLLVVGGTVIAGATGANLALTAVAHAAVDVEAVLDEGEVWIVPTFLTGAVLFGLGWLSFGLAFYFSEILDRLQTGVAILGLVAIVVGLFIPATGGGYLSAGGAIVFGWLVGYRVWLDAGGVVQQQPATS